MDSDNRRRWCNAENGVTSGLGVCCSSRSSGSQSDEQEQEHMERSRGETFEDTSSASRVEGVSVEDVGVVLACNVPHTPVVQNGAAVDAKGTCECDVVVTMAVAPACCAREDNPRNLNLDADSLPRTASLALRLALISIPT